MNMTRARKLEAMARATIDAGKAASWLRKSLEDANPVEAIVLLQIIERAAILRREIEQIGSAMEAAS